LSFYKSIERPERRGTLRLMRSASGPLAGRGRETLHGNAVVQTGGAVTFVISVLIVLILFSVSYSSNVFYFIFRRIALTPKKVIFLAKVGISFVRHFNLSGK
jgi:hypothetical protein